MYYVVNDKQITKNFGINWYENLVPMLCLLKSCDYVINHVFNWKISQLSESLALVWEAVEHDV